MRKMLIIVINLWIINKIIIITILAQQIILIITIIIRKINNNTMNSNTKISITNNFSILKKINKII